MNVFIVNSMFLQIMLFIIVRDIIFLILIPIFIMFQPLHMRT